MARYKGKGRGKGQSNRRTFALRPSAGDETSDEEAARRKRREEDAVSETTGPIHNMEDVAWTKVDSEDEILPGITAADKSSSSENDDVDDADEDDDTAADDEEESDEEDEDVFLVYEKITVKTKKKAASQDLREFRRSHGVAYYLQSLQQHDSKTGSVVGDRDEAAADTATSHEPSTERDILYDRNEFTVRSVRKGFRSPPSPSDQPQLQQHPNRRQLDRPSKSKRQKRKHKTSETSDRDTDIHGCRSFDRLSSNDDDGEAKWSDSATEGPSTSQSKTCQTIRDQMKQPQRHTVLEETSDNSDVAVIESVAACQSPASKQKRLQMTDKKMAGKFKPGCDDKGDGAAESPLRKKKKNKKRRRGRSKGGGEAKAADKSPVQRKKKSAEKRKKKTVAERDRGLYQALIRLRKSYASRRRIRRKGGWATSGRRSSGGVGAADGLSSEDDSSCCRGSTPSIDSSPSHYTQERIEEARERLALENDKSPCGVYLRKIKPHHTESFKASVDPWIVVPKKE